MEFDRILDLNVLLQKKSHFLFGPRMSGKTTLIAKQLKDEYQIISLLHSDYRLRLLERSDF